MQCGSPDIRWIPLPLRSPESAMPELPDITIYTEALLSRILNQRVEAIRIISPSILRTADPPIGSAAGKTVVSIERLGKQIIVGLEDELFLVFHLMIAGRFHWKPRASKPNRKLVHAQFVFPAGTLVLTEASSKKRASLHLVRGSSSLRAFDRGGLEVLRASFEEFRSALTKENHTVKRAITDPRLFSGIGNAYSDEILHRARISPLKWTSKLTEQEIAALFKATPEILNEWTVRLRAEAGTGFPERVTAFHAEMAVHGKFGKPCPDCGTGVQRIVYADNECNYCPWCQTEGRLLADRALSRLLREDWPKTIDET
jgi:formamidopyrimidine-DNA glycosylase